MRECLEHKQTKLKTETTFPFQGKESIQETLHIQLHLEGGCYKLNFPHTYSFFCDCIFWR